MSSCWISFFNSCAHFKLSHIFSPFVGLCSQKSFLFLRHFYTVNAANSAHFCQNVSISALLLFGLLILALLLFSEIKYKLDFSKRKSNLLVTNLSCAHFSHIYWVTFSHVLAVLALICCITSVDYG